MRAVVRTEYGSPDVVHVIDRARPEPGPDEVRVRVEAAGVDACAVAPDHWRHVHNRMSAGQEPRAYTVERHQAWLKRREIEG